MPKLISQPLFCLFALSLFCCGPFAAFGQETEADSQQQYYELRIYRQFDFEKQQQVETYLESALIPALKRQGIEQVGVFTRADDPNDHSVYTLIVYPDLEALGQLNQRLSADQKFQTDSAEYSDQPLKEPVFQSYRKPADESLCGHACGRGSQAKACGTRSNFRASALSESHRTSRGEKG